MNEFRHLRDLKMVLESSVKEDLYTPVLENRLDFLGDLQSFIERLENRCMATDNPAKLLPVVDEELQKLRYIIEQRDERNLADTYLNEVKKISMGYAPEAVISQGKSRFEKLETDSFGVRCIKFGKRVIRTAESFWRGFSNIFRKLLNKPTKAYGPWSQKIPFRNLVEFHLTDVEAMLKSWIDQDHRHLTALVVELEEFLAEDLFDEAFCEEEQLLEKSLGSRTNAILEEVKSERDRLPSEMQLEFDRLYKHVAYFLERAGTLERRGNYYHANKVEGKSSQVRTALSDYLKRWNESHLFLLDKTRMVKDFLSFKQELEEESRDFLDKTKTFFRDRLLQPLGSLREDLSGIRQKLEEFQKKQEDESASHLIKDSKDLLNKLVREIQDELAASVEDTTLSRHANLFAEQGLLQSNKLSEQGLFIDDLDLEQRPPDMDHTFIEWRLLVLRGLKEFIFNKLQPSQQHYEDFLVRIKGSLEEVFQIIEVNMDSALELFGTSDRESDPFEMAIEALERTDTKVETIIGSSEEKLADLEKSVLEGGREFCSKMLHLVHIGDSKELQILDARYKVKQKAKGWKVKAMARWARIQDSLALFWRFGWKKLKSYLVAVGKFLGFDMEEVQTVAKTDVATYLSETDTKISELPYIYRRLFDFEMVTDRRFYVALNENFGYLKKAFESWESGFPATFAVIGEKGSGKSTYLHYALDDFFKEREVKRIQLTGGYYSEVDFIKFMQEQLGLGDVDSVESVIAAIKAAKKKRVLVIENLQNFYLRNINGYGALESLLYVISETKESIFWILSCSSYAWNYLDSTLSVGEYFSHTIQTDTLNEQQIEAVIMNRHRSSGYELVFEPSEAQNKSRAYRKLMDQEEASHEYLRESYFENLTDLSEGNASIAMIFWIRSIREFDDTHFYLKPLEVTSLEMIQELKPDVLFTLAAIVLHDTVTPKELSAVLQMTEQESRLMLMRLKTRGLLQQEEDRYYINHLMYRQILRVLKGRNIIHLV